MNRAIAWFARNRVAANLLMLVMVFGGLLSIPRLVMEVFPEIEIDLITIEVPYPGSTPAEVEELICIRIEEVIHDLQGIERITSTARQNRGLVRVEVESGYDMQRLLDEVKTRVGTITSFPAESERPIITQAVHQREVVGLALYGQTDERSLKVLGERIRDEIAALPDITQVELSGARSYEISVEVSEDALRRHGLNLKEVAAAIKGQSLDLSGGLVKAKSGEILLRTEGQLYRGEQFARLPIFTRADGTTLYLGDIASIKDGFTEDDKLFRFDGMPAVEIEVYRVGGQNVLEVARQVHEYVEKVRPTLPEGINLEVWRDRSEVFRSRLDLLGKNGLSGFFLVIVLLALFLKLRVAFWVALGIPISFLATVWIMPGLVTLNMLTMFAFILVLGIVVDDAIVVGENIYTHQSRGLEPTEAAIKGASQVAIPVVFAVLTTVAAFVPLLRIPGTMGRIWSMLPLIVIPCLLFSLVESLLVLPAHLAHFAGTGKTKTRRFRPWDKVNSAVTWCLRWFTSRIYRPVLTACLSRRYLTLAFFLGVLLMAASLIPGGRLKFTFWPHIESDFVIANLETAPGTPFEVTTAIVQRMEKAAQRLNEEFKDRLPGGPGNIVSHVLAHAWENKAYVRLQLIPSEDRLGTGLGARNLAQRWLRLVGPVPEAVSLNTRSSMGRAHRPINIQLAGKDVGQFVRAAEALKENLRSYPGVTEVEDSFRAGKKEIKLALKPQAVNLGITVEELARQVRQAFYGVEAQRLVRGRDEVKVMVRFPEERRRSLAELEEMRVRTPAGDEVPISAVANFSLGRSFASIERADRSRVVTIWARVDQNRANANEIVADLHDNFLVTLSQKFPGVTYSYEGQLREQEETMSALAQEFGLALFVIFALMAIPFRSYLQPLIVMGAIPFSLIGAVIGHLILGIQLNILSALGFVALAGVVVNDSLVLVHYINRKLKNNLPLAETIVEAGEARLRPILLTSLTTFGGLMPLLLEQSRQAKFLIPMGVSLGFGVMLATFVTLILVPTSYMILEDVRKAFAWLWTNGRNKRHQRLETDT
ncbi:MAG: efflux RND transporter permease subunit [Desulfarculaceae bacterium]